MKWIDNLLNRITMYRLILYYLLALVAIAAIASLFGMLPFSAWAILGSAGGITIACLIVNYIFSRVFKAPTNVESVYITALILALIISPPLSFSDNRFIILAGWASVWAMASKYIFAIRKKHVFNPAAIAVVLTALYLNQSANWWVGTTVLMPFVLIGGLLMVRKLRRFDLVASFLVAAITSIELFSYFRGSDLLLSAQRILLTSPLLFFAFVMLTEPLTTPPTRPRRIIYGLFIGALFAPAMHIGSLYSTPELALVIGNIFSYPISPKEKLMLKLKAREQVAHDTYDFVFEPDRKLKFEPGQYLEWTLPHRGSDTRGNRRYFTIASAPTESDLRVGVKFYREPSSFKKALGQMRLGDVIVASQLAGDFTLPRDPRTKLVFVAGGIGITPFRSMLQYLLDRNEQRDIVVLYSNQTAGDIAYADVLERAENQLGVRTVFTLTRTDRVLPSWHGRTGYLTADMIAEEIPDYRERTFYISGPQAIVTTLGETLRGMGVARSHIKKDFFPGFA